MYPNYLTIQYLEPSASLSAVNISSAVRRLQEAAERIPISHLLIGWQLPPPLLEACRLEADRLGMCFLRWQPLLTADQDVIPDPSWQTVSPDGQRVPGFRGLPEFTFFCPNHPAVQEALALRLEALINQGVYQGFFLDRVRFPSPSADPVNHLACFCKYCRQKAAEVGLDLEEIRREILHQVKSEAGRIALARSLLSKKIGVDASKQSHAIGLFIAFRQTSISGFLTRIAQLIRAAGLEIGLDCFSPSLTPLVGQDLIGLTTLVDWVKLMTYAHTLAPAGLPYELLGMIHYITGTTRLGEAQALEMVSQSVGLPLPDNLRGLEQDGLSPLALEIEVKRGIESCSAPALAGIELVEMPGITHLSANQISADLSAIKRAQPSGLALSWDLWHIPLDRLDLVRQVY